MSAQKNFLLSSIGTNFEIMKALIDGVCAQGGDTSNIIRIIKEPELCKEIVEKLFYHINVDTRNNHELAKRNNCNLNNFMIGNKRYDLDNFKLVEKDPRSTGHYKSKIIIKGLRKDIDPRFVQGELESDCLRLATMSELLAFGIQNPKFKHDKIKGDCSIIALGSIYKNINGEVLFGKLRYSKNNKCKLRFSSEKQILTFNSRYYLFALVPR